MPVSKKIIFTNDKADVISTTYNANFNKNINRSGRKKIIDYYSLDAIYFEKLKDNKAKSIIKKKSFLSQLSEMNEFNYYITIHCSKDAYNRLTDRLRKADKDVVFLSLASWSRKSNLHYHIIVKSELTKDILEKKLVKTGDYDIKIISNQKKLIGYFRKNIVKDIAGVLNSSDPQLKDKQIEILKYKNILSMSKNINKPIVKKISEEMPIGQLEELKDYKYLETINYTINSSDIKIDLFEKNDT